jgi:hypothetical protein
MVKPGGEKQCFEKKRGKLAEMVSKLTRRIVLMQLGLLEA